MGESDCNCIYIADDDFTSDMTCITRRNRLHTMQTESIGKHGIYMTYRGIVSS